MTARTAGRACAPRTGNGGGGLAGSPSRSSPRRPSPDGTATCRWIRASSPGASTERWAAGCARGTSAGGIARDARTWRAGRHRLRCCRPAGRCRPAGSATAPCGSAARRCSATATTPAGRTTGVPISMSSPPPARTRDPARSTSTCGSCPPGSGWRCSTSCSAAATSKTRNCRPGKSTRSSRSWPPRVRHPCWSNPWNGGPPSALRETGEAGARSSSTRAAASRHSRSAPAGTPSTRGTSGGSATWASISPRLPSASQRSPSPGCGNWPSGISAGSWPPGCRPARPDPEPGP